MPWTGLIGPALRLLSKGVSWIGDRADKSPATGKTVDVASVIAVGSAWLGLDPATRAAIGKALIAVGGMMQ